MNLVNLTPHAIVLRNAEGIDTTIEPSGTLARVSTLPGAVHNIPGVPVPVADPDTFVGLVGLPSPQEGTLFIVSGIVGAVLKGSRTDVLMPGTSPADGPIRNEKGHIIAVVCLKRP